MISRSEHDRQWGTVRIEVKWRLGAIEGLNTATGKKLHAMGKLLPNTEGMHCAPATEL